MLRRDEFPDDEDGEDKWLSLRDIMRRARYNASCYAIRLRRTDIFHGRDEVHVEFAHDDVDDHEVVDRDEHRAAAFEDRARTWDRPDATLF